MNTWLIASGTIYHFMDSPKLTTCYAATIYVHIPLNKIECYKQKCYISIYSYIHGIARYVASYNSVYIRI